MTHCLNSPEMTVLERQQARMLKLLQEQGGPPFQQPSQSFFYGSAGSVGDGSSSSFSPGAESLMGLGEVVNRCNIIDGKVGVECLGQAMMIELPCHGSGSYSGYGVSCGRISRTSSCLPTATPAATVEGRPEAVEEQLGPSIRKNEIKKRKLHRVQSSKGFEEQTKEKKIKGCSDHTESKVTELSNNINNGSRDTKKLDYIHVRARRGQATDSHSLAERVRREKISERMKFLQDLVPGCNKVVGKAGMLDEIINYVQSLQRQVEFLSMKLATVNPSLDFDINSLFPKETIPTCTSSFPTINMSSEITNPTYFQLDLVQQAGSFSSAQDTGFINHDTGPRRTASAFSVPIPEPYCFNQMQPTATWESDFRNFYGIEFQQGRTAAVTYQSHQHYTGSVEYTNMKMEA